LPALKTKYIGLLADRLGLLPSSESTLTSHDILHIFDEITIVGLPRYRNLFKFERMNSVLKQLLKNKAHAAASIQKNYNTIERSTMSATLYLANMGVFHNMSTYQPSNDLPVQGLSSYLKQMHVVPADVDAGEENATLYDIPSANVIELRGEHEIVTIPASYINLLLADNSDLYNSPDPSVLKLLMRGYKTYMDDHPIQFKDNMLGYFRFVFHIENIDVYALVLGRHLQRMEQDLRDICEEGTISTVSYFI
jgi:hypothetical protein